MQKKCNTFLILTLSSFVAISSLHAEPTTLGTEAEINNFLATNGQLIKDMTSVYNNYIRKGSPWIRPASYTVTKIQISYRDMDNFIKNFVEKVVVGVIPESNASPGGQAKVLVDAVVEEIKSQLWSWTYYKTMTRRNINDVMKNNKKMSYYNNNVSKPYINGK